MSVKTDASATPVVPQADVAGWVDSLSHLFRVPDDLRDSSFSRAAALELMNDDGTVLDELIARGLPCTGPSGEETFDRFEILNVALYSGTGRTLAEQAIRFATSWMADDPETWFAEKTWNFSVEVSYPEGVDSTAADACLRVARPAPETYGGRCSLQVSPSEAAASEPDSRSDQELLGPGVLKISGEVVSRGERREIVSPQLRGLLGRFSEGYRWTRMPERAQYDYSHVLSSGYAPCITASMALQESCRSAGYQAHTRRGWLLGMLDLPHSWLEVIDDDGEVKVVDPAFIIIAKDHAVGAHPDFAEACMGSIFNRILATEHTAVQPLLSYRAGDIVGVPLAKTAITLI